MPSFRIFYLKTYEIYMPLQCILCTDITDSCFVLLQNQCRRSSLYLLHATVDAAEAATPPKCNYYLSCSGMSHHHGDGNHHVFCRNWLNTTLTWL